MKKIASLFLALMMLLSLAACGGGETKLGNENNKNDITFTETGVVDNDECTITITGIEPDSIWGYTVNVEFVNKSDDITYMFDVLTASINGIKCDPLFAAEVDPGATSNESICFPDSALQENGITKYTDIELTFNVYDTDDWSADDVAEETIHIYPFGEEKAEKSVREIKSSDNIVLDNDYYTVVVTGYHRDKLYGYTVDLFFLNKTDMNIGFDIEDASLNGISEAPFFITYIAPKGGAVSTMSWDDATLQENDITDVTTIKFKLMAYDNDDWTSDYFSEEEITLEP